ncbi:MAG: hypothetical protein E7191_05635 [Erysipelotrichaceae bacterium]|nr:hypothetical protein [Erysipelotrichaceae bacterium]
MVPLLKNTKYTGIVTHCSEGSFVFQYNNETYPFTLFNILYTQEGATEACSRLMGTSTIEIEIDLLAPSNEAYVFIRDELLQQTLIQEKHARIKIANPEYTYYTQLQEAQVRDVSGELELIDQGREFDRTRAQQFFGIQFLGLFLALVFFIVRKIIKKVI